jgi:hypothetical protein
MTAKEREIIEEVMYILENASVGGIGKEGLTQKELDDVHKEGHCAEDDAYLDTCQTAWRLLEKLL